jgi:glyoxylase-like metal-dependent hydrolase (beta-lactamase superfamily II)
MSATEIVPGIFRLPIPLPDNPLGTVNAYAVTVEDGLCLVDCGWNTPQAYQAFIDQLGEISAAVADIRQILVTHIHPDHFGLAQRLAEESGAPVMMHRLEAVYVGARYEHTATLVAEMEEWLRLNGVPAEEVESMAVDSLMMLSRVGTRRPDVLLQGGETLDWGRPFEVIWTPGHASGLVCLYDRERGVLLSSDHVLQRISPHVGLHTQSLGNPLQDYLGSLRLVRDLPVRTILPGHGDPFEGLATRVDEIIAHHDRRCAEILEVLSEGEKTSYQVAGLLRWRGSETGWERLHPFQRRMAVTEVVAHLEYLHGHDRAEKRFRGGLISYGPQ